MMQPRPHPRWRFLDLEGLTEQAIEIADGFFGDGPIDWQQLLDRLEDWSGIDLGSDMTSPLILHIQREVRAARRDV